VQEVWQKRIKLIFFVFDDLDHISDFQDDLLVWGRSHGSKHGAAYRVPRWRIGCVLSMGRLPAYNTENQRQP
jgi:hypothetical protein